MTAIIIPVITLYDLRATHWYPRNGGWFFSYLALAFQATPGQSFRFSCSCVGNFGFNKTEGGIGIIFILIRSLKSNLSISPNIGINSPFVAGIKIGDSETHNSLVVFVFGILG